MKIVERYGAGYRILTGTGAWGALLPLRMALAGIYGLGVALRARRGPYRARRSSGGAGAPAPVVVSIGNIETGGGGKTPCAIALARGIARRGGRAVVITRGYGGSARRRAPCVVSAGGGPAVARGPGFVTAEELLESSRGENGGLAREAEALGDEVLIYRDRGVPVIIDPRRTRGAELARRLFAPSHILLDDAFQNFSIAKDVDILLLDAERPFGAGSLLPLGTLREPPRAALRADAIVFTRARERRVPEAAARFAGGKRVFFADHEASGLVDRRGESVPLAYLAGLDCVLFSGVARPASFERTALSFGAKARAAFRFDDHHRYGRDDVRAMAAEAGPETAFVTTEKDRAKAIDLFPAGSNVLALRVEMTFDRLDDLLDLLVSSSS
jgi:tetraacyldisaccharide 4'-kinase